MVAGREAKCYLPILSRSKFLVLRKLVKVGHFLSSCWTQHSNKSKRWPRLLRNRMRDIAAPLVVLHRGMFRIRSRAVQPHGRRPSPSDHSYPDCASYLPQPIHLYSVCWHAANRYTLYCMQHAHQWLRYSDVSFKNSRNSRCKHQWSCSLLTWK